MGAKPYFSDGPATTFNRGVLGEGREKGAGQRGLRSGELHCGQKTVNMSTILWIIIL